MIRRALFYDSNIARRSVALAASICGLFAIVGMMLPASAIAETLAGTQVINTAALRYDYNGTTQSIASNTVTLIIAERLDVRLVHEGQGAVVVAPSPARPTIVTLTLTNGDNGNEAFALSAALSSAAPSSADPASANPSSATIALRGLAIDGDGDGRYDPATDLAIVDGKTPILAPGQSIAVFAIVVAEADASATTLTVVARSTTGSGAPGTDIADQGDSGGGDGGGDAIVGPTGASASVVVPLTTALSGPALVKSQSVRAADGSQTAVRDAVITYTLEARFTDTVTGVRIVDPIPVGTVFVPGSLTLDGAALSDGADGDAGSVSAIGGSGTSIAVALGQVAAASVHTVQFKAKIQ